MPCFLNRIQIFNKPCSLVIGCLWPTPAKSDADFYTRRMAALWAGPEPVSADGSLAAVDPLQNLSPRGVQPQKSARSGDQVIRKCLAECRTFNPLVPAGHGALRQRQDLSGLCARTQCLPAGVQRSLLPPLTLVAGTDPGQSRWKLLQEAHATAKGH